MSGNSVTYSDAEGALRAWLRGTPSVFALVSDRVYFSLPESDPVVFPAIVLIRVGGQVDGPFDAPRMQFDCWGTSKFSAAAVAYTVAGALEGLNDESATINGGVDLVGSYGTSVKPFYQQLDKFRRYIVESSITVRATV